MEWNWLDALLAGVIVISVVAAMWEGFVREVFSLVSLVAGAGLAALGYERVSELLRGFTETPEIAKCMAFLGIFLATIVIGTATAFLLRKMLQKAGLGWFDRVLGSFLGLIRGLILASVFLLALVAFSVRPAVVQESTLAPYIMMGARPIGALMPQELGLRFQRGLDQFKKALIQKDKRKLER